jgi:hypothetical protein
MKSMVSAMKQRVSMHLEVQGLQNFGKRLLGNGLSPTKMALIEGSSEESREALDVIGIVKGEVATGDGKGGATLRDMLEQDPLNHRNLDIVDNIYDRADRRTTSQLQKQTFIDGHGIKHRIKDKTVAEEHLEKLEEDLTY